MAKSPRQPFQRVSIIRNVSALDRLRQSNFAHFEPVGGSFIRYPDFKGPLPFTPGYELAGVVEKASSCVAAPRDGQIVADLCVVGGYAQ